MSERARLADELDAAVAGVRARLQSANEARERALPLCRSAIRHAANCIRSVHRGEIDRAEELLAQSRAAVGEAAEATRDVPAVFHAGFLHDAQKEFAEASVTLALVTGRPLPTPAELAGGGPRVPARSFGERRELRRSLLDALRRGAVEDGERTLAQMGRHLLAAGHRRLPGRDDGQPATFHRRRAPASSSVRAATTRWRCSRSAWRAGWRAWRRRSRAPASRGSRIRIRACTIRGDAASAARCYAAAHSRAASHRAYRAAGIVLREDRWRACT